MIKVTAKVAEESDEEGTSYLGKYPSTTQISSGSNSKYIQGYLKEFTSLLLSPTLLVQRFLLFLLFKTCAKIITLLNLYTPLKSLKSERTLFYPSIPVG